MSGQSTTDTPEEGSPAELLAFIDEVRSQAHAKHPGQWLTLRPLEEEAVAEWLRLRNYTRTQPTMVPAARLVSNTVRDTVTEALLAEGRCCRSTGSLR